MTLKTSDLCDACDEALPCVLPFRGWGQRRAFAGNIRTLRVQDDIALMRDTIGQPGQGQVLVIDAGGSLKRAVFGDVMAAVAVRNGWAGVVINGAIRDGIEIDAMDIGVKALGTVPKRGTRTGAGEVDVPVTFGYVTFVPGRRLVADDDGVIVLPEGVTEADIRVDDVVAATAAYAATAGEKK
ncbi:MAG TPA: ribonuclease E activity regulator RraA [Ramlibacter sp.]|jgi:regulator of ribonuclease activity A|nr:ribonuclease E activity regulator RraA [Ramlibacter sp.]